MFGGDTLRKYGYPPDKQEQATETVLEQAALLSGEWAADWPTAVARSAVDPLAEIAPENA